MNENSIKNNFDFTPIWLEIKKARESRKITREKLVEKLDISTRHLQAIEIEGRYPSFGLLVRLVTMFDIPIDQYIFPENAGSKSVERKRLDLLLDKLDERDLSIIEATAMGLFQAGKRTEG